MGKDLPGGEEYWVPECVRTYLRASGILDAGAGGHGTAR